ncbi:hypothetical protein WR25_12210 [Diploscapter pachys]|uniref:Eukaryotic translation initiation factor 5A n=1 Tax=Diploscapter pachys TaxID=2018661 RepID=A0A2A2LXC5_9BILA|nr:hypothetical protein WR25_12210 [Diploscapter pachys]
MSEDHHDDDHQFASAESGAAATFPKQCSALRKNECVMIKGRPCKIVEMSTSKTGKHGHAKVHLVALDIFTNKKLEDICPSTHNMDVPVVKRKEYLLMDITDDGFCSLMDPESSDTKDDLKAPEGELSQQLKELLDKGEGDVYVTVVSACGEEAVMSHKVSTKGM